MNIKGLPIRPVILIDTREKHPWDFQGDDAFDGIVHEKIDQGDYSLSGLQHVVSIERKANASELFTNLGQKENRERIYAEMVRMAGRVKYKFIIIEQDLEEVMSPHSYSVNKLKINKASAYMPPAIVMDHLIHFMVDYDVHVIFAGDKGKSIAKRILLMIYDQFRKGRIF